MRRLIVPGDFPWSVIHGTWPRSNSKVALSTVERTSSLSMHRPMSAHPGDPLVSGYTPLAFDLTALLAAHEGETLRLRFAEVDNQFFFQMGVDDVSLEAETQVDQVPEPASILLFGAGVAAVVARMRRRTARS
jgi:hypothetical protein